MVAQTSWLASGLPSIGPAVPINHCPPIGPAVATTSKKRAREDGSEDGSDYSSDHSAVPQSKTRRLQHTTTTCTTSVPHRFLQHPLCLREMLKVTKDHLFHGLGETACRKSLHTARASVKHQLNLPDEGARNAMVAQIPTTLPTLLKTWQLDPTIEAKICCPYCCALHPLPSTELNIQPLPQCNHPRFTTKSSAKLSRLPCGQPLYGNSPATAIGKVARLFFSQPVHSWLGKMLKFSNFENALDASLHRHPPPDHQMEDIWDGELWKTFNKSGPAFTSTSGKLVFGLWCDWFNPGGKNAAKKTSVGVMLLTCFNLPPTMRYKKENICLYGIMPGPAEPSTTEMNHFLRPLVDEMKDFWHGITFESTSKFPKGRKIHAVLWPIHGDVPAMKKVTGFTAHSSANFCSLCHITRDEYHSQFPAPKCTRRTSAKVEVQALEWEQASTAKHQSDLADFNGVRYTVLHELPYWQSVEFFTVDIMHNIFLGIFKDFSTTYLQVPAAGRSLASEKAKMEFSNRQYNTRLQPPDPPRPIRTLQEGTSNIPPAPKPLSHHSHNTRSAAPSDLHNAPSSSGGSDRTIKGKKRARVERSPTPPAPVPDIIPLVTAYELDLLQHCIQDAISPSWTTRPQHNFGMAIAGTPKAADWHYLFKVYIVLAWVPHFNSGEAESTSSKILNCLLQLIQIGNICTLRSFKSGDGEKLTGLVEQHQSSLGHGWPHIKKKPNLHFAEHIGSISTLLGPPAYMASWAGERIIGSLVAAPKNGNQSLSLSQYLTYNQSAEILLPSLP